MKRSHASCELAQDEREADFRMEAAAPEENPAAAMQTSLDWYWELDCELRFSRFVAAADTDEAEACESPLGKTFGELHGIRMSRAENAALIDALSAHKPFRELNLCWEKDGCIRHATISGQPVFVQGEFAGYRGVCKDISEMISAQRKLAQSHAALRELSSALQEFREIERKQIAHELHDELAQLLAYSRMELAMLQQDLMPGVSVRERLNTLDRTIGSSIVSLRRLATALRPSALDEGGLYYALRSLIKSFSESEGICCRFDAEESELVLDGALSTTVYRLIEEALQNTGCHAHAKNIWISARRDGAHLFIRIEDDGCGIASHDLHKEKAFGLLEMRERVVEMKGLMHVDGRPGKGARIEILLPLRSDSEAGGADNDATLSAAPIADAGRRNLHKA